MASAMLGLGKQLGIPKVRCLPALMSGAQAVRRHTAAVEKQGRDLAGLPGAGGQGAGAHHPELRPLGPGSEYGHPPAAAGAGVQGPHPVPSARPRPGPVGGSPQSVLALRPAHPVRGQTGGPSPKPVRCVSHQPRLRAGHHTLLPVPAGDGRKALSAHRGGRAFLAGGGHHPDRSISPEPGEPAGSTRCPKGSGSRPSRPIPLPWLPRRTGPAAPCMCRTFRHSLPICWTTSATPAEWRLVPCLLGATR